MMNQLRLFAVSLQYRTMRSKKLLLLATKPFINHLHHQSLHHNSSCHHHHSTKKSTSHHINTLRFEGLPCTKPIRSILLSHFIVERRLFFQWCSFSLRGAFVVITLCTSQIVLSSLFGNQLFHLHWPRMFAKHDPLCWISSIIGHAPLWWNACKDSDFSPNLKAV